MENGKTDPIGVELGILKAKVTGDTKRKTVMPIIREHVKIGTQVISDEYLPYRSLAKEGYTHEMVNHGAKEYVRGNAKVFGHNSNGQSTGHITLFPQSICRLT